jgi:pectinesterase
VFQYDFAAGEKTATFTLEATEAGTPPTPPCAYARLVPERFDDVAWENDRIAHRVYGAALNTPAAGGERLRGSGIDVWGKRVAYPVVDRWYAKGHDQFHKDGEGEGFDLYSIGGSRGAGGTGIWDGTRLWTSDNFAKAEVLSNGPRRAAFRLSYAPFAAGTAGTAAETKLFTVDCGRNFDTVVSTFDLAAKEAVVGLGLTEHAQAKGFAAATVTRDPDGRWMSVWEESKDGGLGVAVILAHETVAAGYAREAADPRGNSNHLLLVKAQDGMPVRYHTGAGWTRSGQFADRAAWETYVNEYAARALHPLTATVKAQP